MTLSWGKRTKVDVSPTHTLSQVKSRERPCGDVSLRLSEITEVLSFQFAVISDDRSFSASGSLGTHQPDSMGTLAMRRLLPRYRPAVILFLSVWIIRFVLTAFTEIDCQRKASLEEHTLINQHSRLILGSQQQQAHISK